MINFAFDVLNILNVNEFHHYQEAWAKEYREEVWESYRMKMIPEWDSVWELIGGKGAINFIYQDDIESCKYGTTVSMAQWQLPDGSKANWQRSRFGKNAYL